LHLVYYLEVSALLKKPKKQNEPNSTGLSYIHPT